jgi:uncharacterized membrane protein
VVANVSASWITIVALAFATAAIKAAGPVALGGRPLPPRVTAVVVLLAPAILAALVVTETFATGRSLAIDERAVGLAAAAAAIWLRASLPVVVIVAAVAAAAVRAIA